MPSSGLSPRVRGNPGAWAQSSTTGRSIPACAGEPRNLFFEQRDDGVYPRVCGGTFSSQVRIHALNGLSPRVRGNLVKQVIEWTAYRSIPACAGEPPISHVTLTFPRVYPRVCGGTKVRALVLKYVFGLSPRVRGNRDG